MELQVNAFSSYFELFVAFTLAYGGIKGFRSAVNQVFLHNFNKDKVSEVKANNSKQYAKYNTIYGQSPLVTLQRLLEKLEIKIKELNKQYSDANKVYQGDDFQGVFYLVAVHFLTTLILAGFQDYFGDSNTYACLLILTVLCYAYQIYSLINLSYVTKGKETFFNFKKFKSPYLVIKIYSAIAVVLILTTFIFNLFCHPFCTNKVILIQSKLSMESLESMKAVILLFVIFLPFMPYWRFYNRGKDLETYSLRIKEIRQEIEDSIKELSELHNVLYNPKKEKIIELPKKKSAI